MRDDDEDRETPPAVIAAVAAGTGAMPFLAVYSTLFNVRGGFHHVVPNDVTNSNQGELIVGLLCLAAFVIGCVTLLWLLNARRRWPFVVIQAALLAVAIDFMIDPTKGGRVVSGLIIATSFVGLVVSAHPQVWEHLGLRCPKLVALAFGRRPAPRTPMPAGSAPTADTVPTAPRLVGKRPDPS